MDSSRAKVKMLLFPVTSACGVVGNLLSLAVLLTDHYRSKVYGKLLLSLAVADTALLLMVTAEWAIEAHNFSRTRMETHAHHAIWPLFGFSHVWSIYATVTICIERYVVISRLEVASRKVAFRFQVPTFISSFQTFTGRLESGL